MPGSECVFSMVLMSEHFQIYTSGKEREYIYELDGNTRRRGLRRCVEIHRTVVRRRGLGI